MTNKKNKRKAIYLRLLLPTVLVGLLVFEGLFGYAAPDPYDGLGAAPANTYAAEPKLELQEQTGERQQSKGPAPKLSKVEDPDAFVDGSYIGSAAGFGGNIKVKVIVKDKKIASIQILSASGETGSYFSRAKAVISRILKKQSTNVDGVSGATYSSNGIIKAVRNALKKMKKKDDKKEKPQDETKEDDPPVVIPEDKWKDGTYTGTGMCTRDGLFDYDVNISLTISEGRISDITVTKGEDYTEDQNEWEENDAYLNLAANGPRGNNGMVARIIAAQNASVDTVSGATYSSKTIKNVVAEILAGVEKAE